jgi:hypothetical protein
MLDSLCKIWMANPEGSEYSSIDLLSSYELIGFFRRETTVEEKGRILEAWAVRLQHVVLRSAVLPCAEVFNRGKCVRCGLSYRRLLGQMLEHSALSKYNQGRDYQLG